MTARGNLDRQWRPLTGARREAIMIMARQPGEPEANARSLGPLGLRGERRRIRAWRPGETGSSSVLRGDPLLYHAHVDHRHRDGCGH